MVEWYSSGLSEEGVKSFKKEKVRVVDVYFGLQNNNGSLHDRNLPLELSLNLLFRNGGAILYKTTDMEDVKYILSLTEVRFVDLLKGITIDAYLDYNRFMGIGIKRG